MILINRTRKIVKPLFVPFGDGHGVSQNINIEAYDSTGGAGWEIDLNSDALEQASKDYTAAATAYSKALETMIKALKDLGGAWEGNASQNWNQKSESLQKNLSSVEELLKNNAINVKEIADATSSIETGMAGSVDNI